MGILLSRTEAAGHKILVTLCPALVHTLGFHMEMQRTKQRLQVLLRHSPLLVRLGYCAAKISAKTYISVGTGITIVGIFSYDIIGSVSVNYTLDGITSSQDYTVTSSTPQFTKGYKQEQNFVLFAAQWLEAGNHTLELKITNCVNQIFALDYILYNPAFNSLATKSSLPSAQTIIPSSTSQAAVATNGSLHAAAILGGVLGTVTGLLLILLFVLYRKWLITRRMSTPPMSAISISTSLPLH